MFHLADNNQDEVGITTLHKESQKGFEQPGVQEKETLEELTKQIAKGGGVSFFGQVIGRVIKFLFHILLTRVLGVSAYGLYALGLNVFGIGHTFALLGLPNGVIRFGSMYRGEGDKNRLKGTLLSALVISVGSSFIISFLLFFSADFISVWVFKEPNLTKVLQMFAFSLPFYTTMIVAAYSARAFKRMEYDAGVQFIFHPLTNLIAVGVAFLLGYRLLGAIFGFLIASILSAILGIYLLFQIFPELISGLKAKYELKKLLTYSLTVLLIGFSHLLLLRTDRIMLGIFGIAKEVGVYNAAVVVAFQASLFLTSFNAIFSPIIANLYHQERINQLSSLFKTTTKWIFGLTLPVFLFFVLFPKQIMAIFGPEFTIGWTVLVTLGFVQLISASAGASAYMLIMSGREKIELANGIVLGGLNVFMNILLIPRYGILGAAIATGLSLFMINLARLLEIYYLYRIHPFKFSYLKVFFSGVLTTISWLLVLKFFKFGGWLWLVGIVLVGSIYFIILFMLGLDQEDKNVLEVVKKRFIQY